MKHCAAILLLVLFLACCTFFACAPGESMGGGFDKGESNMEENAFFNGYLAARMGDLVYFTEEKPLNGGRRIYVYDSASGEVFPLCAKPDCTHDSGECRAAYPSTFGDLFMMPYGDRLFFLGDAERREDKTYLRIYSQARDGSDRKIESKFKWELGSYVVSFVGIYDGIVYKLGSTIVIENGEQYEEISLCSQPLGEDGEVRELFRERVQDPVFMGAMRAGKLWFAVYDGDGNCIMHLYSYDTETDEINTEFEGKAPGYAFRMAALEDRLVFHEGRTVFAYSFEEKAFKEMLRSDDDQVIRYGGVMFEWTGRFDFRCYAEDGSLMHEGTLDEALFDGPPIKTYLGCINGKFCFLFECGGGDGENEGVHNYFVVYDSQTNTFSVPWDSDMK